MTILNAIIKSDFLDVQVSNFPFESRFEYDLCFVVFQNGLLYHLLTNMSVWKWHIEWDHATAVFQKFAMLTVQSLVLCPNNCPKPMAMSSHILEVEYDHLGDKLLIFQRVHSCFHDFQVCFRNGGWIRKENIIWMKRSTCGALVRKHLDSYVQPPSTAD